MSADGRYFLFGTTSNLLDSTDSNGLDDVYLYDRISNTTRLLSTITDRDANYGPCRALAISSNGRYAAFQCYPNENSWFTPITVTMDLQSGQYWTVNIDDGGFSPSAVSDDGIYLADAISNIYFDNSTRQYVNTNLGGAAAANFQLLSSTGTIIFSVLNTSDPVVYGLLQVDAATNSSTVITRPSACQTQDPAFCNLGQYRLNSRSADIAATVDGKIVLFLNATKGIMYSNSSTNTVSRWMFSPGVPLEHTIPNMFDNFAGAVNADGSIMAAYPVQSSQVGCEGGVVIYNVKTQTTAALMDGDGNCVSGVSDLQIVKDCLAFTTSSSLVPSDVDGTRDFYCHNLTTGENYILATQTDGTSERPVTTAYITRTPHNPLHEIYVNFNSFYILVQKTSSMSFSPRIVPSKSIYAT
jgi:hypothetical protein